MVAKKTVFGFALFGIIVLAGIIFLAFFLGAPDTTAPGPDDDVVIRVKSYIDSGTCDRVSSSTNCGNSAESYYKEFTYNGRRIVVSNQVPDPLPLLYQPHEHEACERYQYISLPLQPAKGSSKQRTEMGSIGTAVTGAAFINDWSDRNGKVPMSFEALQWLIWFLNLDSCFGRSPRGGSNINCTDAGSATGAVDPDTCKLIGFYRDGVPVYGLCKDQSGMMMRSCYSCTGACISSVTHESGNYTGLGANSEDHTYDQAAFNAGICNLDEANGAVHPTTGEYSYFMTTTYPWTPIYYFGDEGINPYCSAAA